jgi:hypothetical protein
MAHPVIVNGRKRSVEQDSLTYDQVVKLAFDSPPTGENIVITVTFKYIDGDRNGGSLKPGGTLIIRDGMVIDVTATDRS